MIPLLTSNSVANQAIQLMGNNQDPVTGSYPNFDNSASGIALNILYGATVAAISRQFGWDFARAKIELELTGNIAPFPWLYEYFYAPSINQIWQIMPKAVSDYNNPSPILWSVGNSIVGNDQTKVIWTNQADAICYCNNNPKESTWDSLFTQAVVRLLSNALSTALAGRPDTAMAMLETGSSFEALGEGRDS